MKPLSCFASGIVFLSVACSSNKPSNEIAYQPEQPRENPTMSNPASVHCTDAGGVLTLAKQLDGGTIGMCQLPNGKRCEEWALMRGACLER